ncbi:MAG TPA: alpha/beta hydrolase, partial [Micropruina sp.]|nr:alpha/beta hydrolase [Micropruina sp.]
MYFISEQVLDGIVERSFTLDEFSGVLWTPRSTSATEPAPLILAGPPGGPVGLDVMYPRLRQRAQAAADVGFATA